MYKGPVNWSCVLIQVCDSFIVLGVFTPVLLACWAGLWKIMDIFIFPKDGKLTGWTCLAIGLSLLLFFNLFQKVFFDATRNIKPLLYGFLWRLHAYVGIITAAVLWRGVWKVMEVYTGKSVLSLVISSALAAAILIPLRTFNVVNSVPGQVVREAPVNPFQIHTRFQTVPSCSCKFVLDVLLNAVISVLLVIYFRGVFELMGQLVFPGDKVRSLWACMMIGYFVVVLCIVAQRYMVMIYRALKDKLLLQIALDDTYIFVVSFGSINVWKGWWAFFDVYLLATGNGVLRGALLHLAGMLVAYLLCTSRALSFPLGPVRLDGSLNCPTDNVMGMYLEDKECCCFETFHVTDDNTFVRPKDKHDDVQKAEEIMLIVVSEEESKDPTLKKKEKLGYGSTPEY